MLREPSAPQRVAISPFDRSRDVLYTPSLLASFCILVISLVAFPPRWFSDQHEPSSDGRHETAQSESEARESGANPHRNR